MSTWSVYYRGTSNLAVSRVYAASAREATSLASMMTGTPVAFLIAKRAESWEKVELKKLEQAFAAIIRKVQS
jgi:hypothetical protein